MMLILATSTFIGRISDLTLFTIRINNDQILKAIDVTVVFRKNLLLRYLLFWIKWIKLVWKIWQRELELATRRTQHCKIYSNYLSNRTMSIEGVSCIKKKLEGFLEPKVADDLTTIIESVMQAKTANFNLEFDPTLVHGMSYYGSNF